jgi:hypothetical protein
MNRCRPDERSGERKRIQINGVFVLERWKGQGSVCCLLNKSIGKDTDCTIRRRKERKKERKRARASRRDSCVLRCITARGHKVTRGGGRGLEVSSNPPKRSRDSRPGMWRKIKGTESNGEMERMGRARAGRWRLARGWTAAPRGAEEAEAEAAAPTSAAGAAAATATTTTSQPKRGRGRGR